MALAYGSDVLKEAIIKKLKDYDAYIDNELPDYILVMLANKKTVTQISQDLELFLADDTDRFTKWLRGVLENPEVLAPSVQGKKRSISELEDTRLAKQPIREEQRASSPPRRKIVIRRSVQEEDKETNQSSSMYKRTEIVHETTTRETTHHTSKQSEVTMDTEGNDEEDDDIVSPMLSSVVKKADNSRGPQPSGRILLKAISAIQGTRGSRQQGTITTTGRGTTATRKKTPLLTAVDPMPTHTVTTISNTSLVGGTIASHDHSGEGYAPLVAREDLRTRLSKKVSTGEVRGKETEGTSLEERIILRPKFVVTMNSVGDQYDTPVKMIESATESDVIEETFKPAHQTKLAERCRFWPNCKNGETCPYHHPSIPCKLFPKCKFGDKCKFIHPVCKFNAGCTKPGCPFLHTAPRSKQSVGQTPHPIPTGGGMYKSPSPGTVSHYKWNPGTSTTKPRPNQYVWTPPSNKSHISERKFVSSDSPTGMAVPANV